MEELLLNGDYLQKNKKRNQGIALSVLLVFIALFFVVFLFFNLTVSVCSVDGNSMLNTLVNEETLLLEKKPDKISRGDIVTIGGMSTVLIIKRVIGIKGDKLVFKRQAEGSNIVDLYRDKGEGYVKLDESEYIKEPMTTYGWGADGERRIYKNGFRLAPEDTDISDFGDYAIVVQDGECFVMGDNRNESSDSRVYGAGKVSNIEGKMFYRVAKNSLLEKILLFIYREKGDNRILWSKSRQIQ